MSDRLTIPAEIYPGSGCAITFHGDAPDQIVSWQLVSFNPETLVEAASMGFLKWRTTYTGKHKKSVNYYFAPDGTQIVRYNTGRVYNTGVKYNGDAGLGGNVDKVKVTYAV